MILNTSEIADLLGNPDKKDPLVITPTPNLEDLRKTGAASLDLRLGTWFLTLRQTKMTCLDVTCDSDTSEMPGNNAKYIHVPFGDDFVLHPRSFVLGATLEWIRLSRDLAAIVTGKSSWGRSGLVIATATGVHPGFTGCLTLEITNLGQIPLKIKPGMRICQLFLHMVKGETELVDRSQFNAQRRPVLGVIKIDEVSRRLSSPS